MLKVYTAQIKKSLHAQSQVVEEALVEFFEKRGFKIKDIKENNGTRKPFPRDRYLVCSRLQA